MLLRLFSKNPNVIKAGTRFLGGISVRDKTVNPIIHQMETNLKTRLDIIKNNIKPFLEEEEKLASEIVAMESEIEKRFGEKKRKLTQVFDTYRKEVSGVKQELKEIETLNECINLITKAISDARFRGRTEASAYTIKCARSETFDRWDSYIVNRKMKNFFGYAREILKICGVELSFWCGSWEIYVDKIDFSGLKVQCIPQCIQKEMLDAKNIEEGMDVEVRILDAFCDAIGKVFIHTQNQIEEDCQRLEKAIHSGEINFKMAVTPVVVQKVKNKHPELTIDIYEEEEQNWMEDARNYRFLVSNTPNFPEQNVGKRPRL